MARATKCIKNTRKAKNIRKVKHTKKSRKTKNTRKVRNSKRKIYSRKKRGGMDLKNPFGLLKGRGVRTPIVASPILEEEVTDSRPYCGS